MGRKLSLPTKLPCFKQITNFVEFGIPLKGKHRLITLTILSKSFSFHCLPMANESVGPWKYIYIERELFIVA